MSLLQIKQAVLEQPALFIAPRKYLWATDLQVKLANGTIVGACHRAVWYGLTGVPKSNQIPARSLRIMALGKAAEKAEQETDKLAGIYIGGNVKFYDFEWNVSGEVDEILSFDRARALGLYRGKERGHWLVEYKTGYGPYFRKAVKLGPKPEALVQVLPYLKFFLVDRRTDTFAPGGQAEQVPPQVQGIRFVYIDRADPNYIYEHVVTLGERNGVYFPVVNGKVKPEFSFAAVESRLAEFWPYLENKECPPRSFDNNYWLCKGYCNYRDKCNGKAA